MLPIHKPAGVTSHDVVLWVRHLLGGARTGHCGTLDPAATGVLLVCLGKTTRLAEYLTGQDKGYRTVVLLDRRTSTGDLDGEVTELFTGPEAGGPPSRTEIESALEGLRGAILQKPHRVSAVRHQGRRLYELAREGAEAPDLPARRITVHSLELKAYRYPRLELEVSCSSGTYIRQLAEDLGEKLGLGGCLESLCRTRVGELGIDRTVTPFEAAGLHILDRLGQAIVPASELLTELGEVMVGPEGIEKVRHGAAIPAELTRPLRGRSESELVKLLGPDRSLLAICRRGPDGRLEPRKVLI